MRAENEAGRSARRRKSMPEGKSARRRKAGWNRAGRACRKVNQLAGAKPVGTGSAEHAGSVKRAKRAWQFKSNIRFKRS